VPIVLDEQGRRELEAAYRKCGADLWRALYAFGNGDQDLADEVVSEVFVQAAHALGGIRDLKPWLFAASFRIARGELKRRRRLVPLEHAPSNPTPHQAATDLAQEVNDLLALLGMLTLKERSAFVLREVLGYPTAETARLLGITEGAVRVRIHGARSRLRRLAQEVERS
jgi:RNA polymerase sigma-70 factor (ECF subfamily)